MEPALRKRDSGVAQKAPSDRPLPKTRSRGRRRGFCGSRSREGARRCRARVSRLEDEYVPNARSSIKSRRGLATGFIVPGIDGSIDLPLAEVALRGGVLAADTNFMVDNLESSE